MDSNTPSVAPTTPRNRLFFRDSSEIGSCTTSIQCFQLMSEKARALGTME